MEYTYIHTKKQLFSHLLWIIPRQIAPCLLKVKEKIQSSDRKMNSEDCVFPSLSKHLKQFPAQSAGNAEYTNCISAEG